MSEVQVLGGMGNPVIWGSSSFRFGSRQEAPRQAKPEHKPAQTGNAWLSAEDVAQMILSGECLDARVSVPPRFAPAAVRSAVNSVERWQREGRIFAIHELFPRYQFDARGRPYAPVERALAVLGTGNVLRVGNWFATPNLHLDGRRPQELLATAPDEVLRALEFVR